MPDQTRHDDPLQPRPFLAEPGEEQSYGPPRDRGGSFSRALAVAATFVLVLAVIVLQFLGRAATPGPPSGEIDPPDLQMLLMGRMAMGVEALTAVAGPGAQSSAARNAEQLMRQLDDLAAGGAVREWVRTAIIAAELEDLDQAYDRLIEADEALGDLESNIYAASQEFDEQGNNILTDERAAELQRIKALDADIDTLYAIYEAEGAGGAGGADAAGISQDARDGLVKRHGYFGEVALTHGLESSDPRRQAVLSAGMRTMFTLIGAFVIGGLALLAGFVLFVIAMIKLLSRKGIARRYSPPAFGGSVYLETFALFLAGFLVISVIGAALQSMTSVSLDFALPWLLLLVPFWPLLRGQPWANHKHALGWTRGEGIVREVLAGVVGYLALLPIFLLGVIATILLSILIALVEQWLGREPPGPMTHPIMERLVGGDLKTLLVLLSLAAVWAPLVEETVFRGAFFHHLRGRWGLALCALATGFVFAIIHPQGFAAVPALMSLGFSFALLREWRGSIIAPVTAHAMHNGFLVTMLWLALS